MLVEIWQRNLAIFRSVVRNILPDGADPDDVLQDAFTRILECKLAFTSETEAFNYLRRVVVNHAIDSYRKIRRWQAAQVDECVDYCGSGSSTPLTALIREEQEELQVLLLREVEEALDSLPAKQRRAVEIFFNRKPDNKSLKEVCREKGVPYSTLRCRVVTAIDKIRKQLKKKGVYRSLEEVSR